MWPFRASTDLEPLARLEHRVNELERQAADREIEWSEWFDKFRRLYARIAKRAERDPEAAPASRQDAPGATNSDGLKAQVSPHHRRSLRGF